MRTFLRAFLFSCLFYFLAIVVLFRLGAFSQTKPEQPSYELTELQKARLDATRQEVFRWQDKLNEALGKFSAQDVYKRQLGTITSANKGYVFGITLEFPLSTSKIFYDVTNSDNTGNEYDLAVYQGAPSGTENRLLHTGSSASTGQPGTTFAPAMGWQHLNWYERCV